MKNLIIAVGVAVLWSLGQSQTFPYVSFMNQTLANHSYVDLSQVGRDLSGSHSVQCHTDLITCCSGAQGPHRGDWYFPNGERLPTPGSYNIIFESRKAKRVDLHHTSGTSPSGIYHCDIQTTAVSLVTDNPPRDTVYVGLYASSQGSYSINHNNFVVYLALHFITSGDITIFNVTLANTTNLNRGSLQFTLTCISTGGPATTVTWTRDSVTVTEGTQTVLNDPETAQYTHTLTETGSLGVNYTCTVTNNKPSTASATYITQGNSSIFFCISNNRCPMTVAPGQPVIGLSEATETVIFISWSVPSVSLVNQYEVQWSSHQCPDSPVKGSTAISRASTSFIITELRAGTEYNVSVTAVNSAGNSTSDVLNIHTLEIGEARAQ